MKVLLLGEYSGVHNNLSQALKDQGIEVTLISDGDGYKSFNSDFYISYKHKQTDNRIFNKFLNLYYVGLSYSGFKGILQILKHVPTIKTMQGYDIVQLVNPIFLTDFGSVVNLIVFNYLKKNNKKVFLCALGDDYFWVKWCLNKNVAYSMFDNYNYRTIKQYLGPLNYAYGFLNPFLNKYIAKHVNAVIPGSYDYYTPYKHLKNCAEIVPIIIEKKNSHLKHEFEYPINIFHGWQSGKDNRKGNDIFDRAIRRLVEKHPDKVSYNIVSGVTYAEYIKTFQKADIFIDQCYSLDKGMNALLGMSEGKVVFSGFDPIVKKYYDINYDPLVNAVPNENKISLNLEKLILDKQLIKQYSLSAKKFVDKFHNPKYVLDKLFQVWKSY